MTDTIGAAIADPNTYAQPSVSDALFAQLRRDEPVRWTAPDGIRPFWLLTRHADIVEVERQPELFISAPRLQMLTIREESLAQAAHEGGTHATRTMLHMDGMEHRAYRGITQAWFMPSRVRTLEGKLAALAKEYVDRLEAKGGACDFVKDVAVWYPLRVIMTILGVPPEEEPEMLRLTLNFVGREDTNVIGTGSKEEQFFKAAQEIFDYFAVIYEDRRKNPRDDLASVIAQATIDGKPLNHFEAMSYYLLIATAGHDTTSATIAGGLLALIENPAELEKLRADPALVAPAADEMLRWSGPVKHFFRTAVQDYTLRGQTIKAGEAVMMVFPSANRDEEAFEDPYSFRIDRTPNPHLALGHGAHACLGQHLAKMEIRALFRELIPRLEHIEVAGPLAYLASTQAGGLTTLPIRYRMRKV